MIKQTYIYLQSMTNKTLKLVSRKTTFTYLHDIGKVQTTQMIKIFKMSQVRSVLAHSLGTIERSASDAFT